MPSARTLKRRQQRQAHKAKIAAWRAEWATMSPVQQQAFKERRRRQERMLEEVNRVALEIWSRSASEVFLTESPLIRYLKARR